MKTDSREFSQEIEISRSRTSAIENRLNAYGTIHEQSWLEISRIADEHREEGRELKEVYLDLHERNDNQQMAWSRAMTDVISKRMEIKQGAADSDRSMTEEEKTEYDDLEERHQRIVRKAKEMATDFSIAKLEYQNQRLSRSPANKIHSILEGRIPESKKLSIAPIIDDNVTDKARKTVGHASAFFAKTMASRFFVNQDKRRLASRTNPDHAIFLTGSDVHRSHGFQPKVHKSGVTRASYVSGYGIQINEDVPASTVVHEFAHMLEDIPAVKEAENDLLSRRIDPDETINMRGKFKYHNFEESETGNKDDFGKVFGDDGASAYYAGKTYEDGSGELVSMGIEMMFKDPVTLTKDRELFDFVSSVMDGTIGGNPRDSSEAGKTNPWGVGRGISNDNIDFVESHRGRAGISDHDFSRILEEFDSSETKDLSNHEAMILVRRMDEIGSTGNKRGMQ